MLNFISEHRKNGIFAAAFLVVSLAAFNGKAREVAGITMPDSTKAGGAELVLNGAGVRTKLLMDIYVVGLYVKNKQQNARQIIDADEPMAIRMHIVSRLVTPDNMSSNVEEGFSRSTQGNIAPIKDRRDKMISVFKNGIQKDDVYDLVYVPGKGVLISKNGELKQTIPGLDFKKALFGIWLSQDPICAEVKKQLLGN